MPAAASAARPAATSLSASRCPPVYKGQTEARPSERTVKVRSASRLAGSSGKASPGSGGSTSSTGCRAGSKDCARRPVSIFSEVESRPANPFRRRSGPSMRRSASACNVLA